MGNTVSELIDNSDEKEAKAKEQLEMLMKLADARLDTFESELKTMFLDKDCERLLRVLDICHLRLLSSSGHEDQCSW